MRKLFPSLALFLSAVFSSPVIAIPKDPFAGRTTKKSLTKEGGNRTTEKAVDMALDYLVRSQNEDGSWSASQDSDTDQGGRVSNKKYKPSKGFKPGITGLAVLAFTSSGHTHLKGKPEYVEALKKAVDYLKSVQKHSPDRTRDGLIGGIEVFEENDSFNDHWMYNHAIASLALTELLILSKDEDNLKESVQAAIEFCLHAQNGSTFKKKSPSKHSTYGWRYQYQEGTNDSSVTSWMAQTIHTAQHASLDIPSSEFKKSLKGISNWFEKATAKKKSAQGSRKRRGTPVPSLAGRIGYQIPGDEGARWAKQMQGSIYPFSKKETQSMTAAGTFCKLLNKKSSRSVRDSIDWLMKSIPEWREYKNARTLSKVNFYYWYYGTNAMFQAGGTNWKKWNKAMKKVLLANQRKSGDEKGSWDIKGEWSPIGGRVYTTALSAMCLQVYYRYPRFGTKGF